jgi:2-polyprenyl-3-methyl-5-hydroxy-6-metoxy-1,4-benzoquinol methylase
MEHPFCIVCRASEPDLASEVCEVHSNVRAFSREAFAVWRCAHCLSLHARDEVDLDAYYGNYPLFSLPNDWRTRAIHNSQLARLQRAGLRRTHRILDFGCGAGAFVEHLKSEGFDNTFGYDEYSAAFRDRSVLGERFDFVVSQDVLEHVPDPGLMLEQLAALTLPGGVIAIGTPNAEAIDLSRSSYYRHALHLPYHRHILSKTALLHVGESAGLRFEHYYPTQYTNTRVPFLNSRFYRFFMQALDDTLDCLVEPPRIAPILVRLPQALFWGIFGSLFAEETDIMVMFRKDERGGTPSNAFPPRRSTDPASDQKGLRTGVHYA